MKKIIFFILLGFYAAGSLAQTDVNLSQRNVGRMNYNPAAVGANPDYISFRAFFREQWFGFDRAPSTQIVNVDNYFNKYNSGAGLVFIKDEIGFSKMLNFKLSYAYHLQLNPDSYIALGLSLGLIHNSFDERNFTPEDENDPNINYLVNKETLADFDVGAEYHWKNLNAGFSIAHITKGRQDLKVTPHYYGYLNYAMNLDENWQLMPSIFTVQNSKASLYELGAISEFRSKIKLGLIFRANEKFMSEALVGILGVMVSDAIHLGYSYDFKIGYKSSNVTGAHEIMLAFRMDKKRKDK